MAPPTTSPRSGAVLVTVSWNSGTTRNGWASLPSGLRAPPVAASPDGGTAPLPGTALSTAAVPTSAVSRYLPTNVAQSIACGCEPLSPNSTSRSTGPTENVALAWNGGPVTSTFADSDTEIEISPIQTSIVTPALIEA